MRNPLYTVTLVCGLLGALGSSLGTAQTPVMPVPAPDLPQTTTAPETQYAPLGQVVPRVTRESGVQIEARGPLLLEQVPVRESEPDRNVKLKPVLDEFSRIELFGENSELRKVIILNRNTGADSQAPSVKSHPTPKSTRHGTPKQKHIPNNVSQPFPETKLSKKQLQELIRGAYRSALPEKLWDDPEYREFLIEQGITSQKEMSDRNKAKNLRKTVRRLLWQLKKKS